jgi:hypothetical protein
MLNISGFTITSLTAPHSSGGKAAIDDMEANRNGHLPIKLY